MKMNLFNKKNTIWILILILIFSFWTGIAYIVQNPFICPYPLEVLQCMLEQSQSETFYLQIMQTLMRVILSFGLSFIVGISFAMFTFKKKRWIPYIEKIMLILRSIPNITFIILFLFWMHRETTITAVAFLLLFPIVYQNSLAALQEIYETYHDVLSIYPQTKWDTIRKIYIPLMKPSLFASSITTLSLSFKVTVMAEILAQVPYGIGRSMQWEKLNVNLAGVMAWTIWLLIFVFISHAIMKRIGEKMCH